MGAAAAGHGVRVVASRVRRARIHAVVVPVPLISPARCNADLRDWRDLFVNDEICGRLQIRVFRGCACEAAPA